MKYTIEEINKALQEVGIDFEFINNIQQSKPWSSGNNALFKCLVCNKESVHRKDKLMIGRGFCPHCKANNTKQLIIRKETKRNQLQDRLLSYGFNFLSEGDRSNIVSVECLTCKSIHIKRKDKIFSKIFTCCQDGDVVDIHEKTLQKIIKLMSDQFIIHRHCKNIKDTVELECKNCHYKFKRFGGTILYPNGRDKKQRVSCPKCKFGSIIEPKKYKGKAFINRSFSIYENIVRRISLNTNEFYTKHISSKEYHIDHCYSISEGYKNGIEPWIIGSPINLRLIPKGINLSKGIKSSITLLDLYKEFFKWVGNNPDYFEKIGMLGLLTYREPNSEVNV
jgi:hypothetical protein